MGTVILIIVVGLGCMILGFCGGRYEPLESVIRAEIEARLTAELDAAYDEGAKDERAIWLDVLGPAEASRLRPRYLAAAAAEVPGGGLPDAEPADLAGPDAGESPAAPAAAGMGADRLGRHAGQLDAGQAGPGPDVGADAPGLRDPRELADTRAEPWEPAPGDLILRQAGHHYDASPGAAPGPGLSQSAATAAGPGEDTTTDDIGPAEGFGLLLDLMDDGAAFSMIRDEFTALRIETVAWRPALPAWTERRAA